MFEHPSPRRTPRRRFVRPTLELLEDRCVPATITVNSNLDTALPPAGTVTLRSAIVQAEADPSADAITFAASLTGQTIVLGSALPTLTNGETIAGPGPANLTVQANAAFNNPFNVFTANSKALVTISGLTITGGFVFNGDGGGVLNFGALALGNDVITGNSTNIAQGGRSGGGVANETPTGPGLGIARATLSIANTVISGNSVQGSGGGLYNTGKVTITQSTIVNNSASTGGGVANETITGEGFVIVPATLSIDNSVISNNEAAGGGGAIYNNGQVTVTRSTIGNNNANVGGGIQNDSFPGAVGPVIGNLTINAATVSGNTATNTGGGIRNDGVLVVRDSTLANNKTVGNVGGGISNGGNNSIASTGTLTVEDSTIVANIDGSNSFAFPSGGISIDSTVKAQFTLNNTVVAQNTTVDGTAPDIYGAVTFGQGDFIRIGDGNLSGIADGTNGNQIGTKGAPREPQLGPLQDNGGPTFTQAPLAGSPLIDTGVNAVLPAGLNADQRGLLRVVGPSVDIGAVEFQPPATATGLTVAPTATTFGKTVTLTATVAPQAAGPNNPVTGSVTFFNGTTPLGTVPLGAGGMATLPFTPPNAGNFTFGASYSGDVNYTASTAPPVTLPVAPQPTTTTLAAAPTEIILGQSVTLTATVAVVIDPPLTGSVTFFNGATPLGTVAVDTNGVATLTFTPQTPGKLSLTARYAGTNDFSSSAAAPVTVTARRKQTIGVFDPFGDTWYLKNSDGPGAPDVKPFQYGGYCWNGLTGDWNGTGRDTVAVVDPATETWYIKLTNTAGAPDIKPFQYGAPGWIPLAGDWDGNGTDTIAVVDPATETWYIKNTNSAGAPDIKPFQFGAPGWIPVVGDWNGTGHTGIGAFDPTTATWYLRNEVSAGAADAGKFQYGGAMWTPVVGDWTGSGKTTVAVYDPNATWYIKFSNSAGAPDIKPFQYGGEMWTPVAGNWQFPAGTALHADAAGTGTVALDNTTLQAVVAAALGRLSTAGVDPSLVQRLASATYEVGALSGDTLGLTFASENRVEVSATAAGRGWFTDASAASDAEYANGWAKPGTAAATGIDLLTTVLHEMGHLTGRVDLNPAQAGDGVLTDVLGAGHRRVQTLDQVFGAGF